MVRGSLSGILEPLFRYEPCPLTPVYYAMPHLGLYRQKERKGRARARTHKMIKEGIIDDTDNGTSFIDEPQRYADEWESMDKVCSSICLHLARV